MGNVVKNQIVVCTDEAGSIKDFVNDNELLFGDSVLVNSDNLTVTVDFETSWSPKFLGVWILSLAFPEFVFIQFYDEPALLGSGSCIFDNGKRII